MKKLLAGVLTAVCMFSFGTTSVFAACPGRGHNYVDADQNYICDYAGSNCSFTDADGDGICDNCGLYPSYGAGGHTGGYGCGLNYVDADGDGICDNYNAGTGTCQRYSTGYGTGYRAGHRGHHNR